MVECEICLEEYQEEYLQLHQAKCISRLVFRCSLCDEDYVSKEGLWNHLDLHEIEDESKELHCQEKRVKHKLHQCADCNDQRAYSASFYKKHVNDVHNSSILRCSDCGENFESEELKNDHVLNRCNMRDLTATIEVGNMTSDAEHLKQTRTEQTDNTNEGLAINKGSELPSISLAKCKELRLRFGCDVCGTTFARKNLLDRHKIAKYSCVEGRRQRCPHCRRNFQKNEYQAHLSLCVTRRFSCELCPLKFNRPKVLEGHIRKAHRGDGDAAKNVKQTGESRRSCAEIVASSSNVGEDRDISTVKDFTDRSVEIMIENSANVLSGLKCPHCGKKLPSAFYLRQHIVRYHQPIKCSICGISFEGTEKIRYHKIKKHMKPSFQCAKCSKKFYFSIYHKQHSAICDRKPNDLSSNKNSAITLRDRKKSKRTAKTSSTNVSRAKCSSCGIEESSPGTLGRHILMHHDPVACDYCGITFPSLSQAQNHMKTEHKESDSKCQHCAKRFSSKGRLEKHISHCQHGKIPCDICGRMYKNRAAIAAHKRNTCHSYKKIKEQEQNNAETSLCDEADSSSAVEKISPKTNCNYCDEEFSSQGHLKHHLQTYHELTKCDICGITILGISSTQNHKIKFHKATNYECPKCGKKFHYKVEFDMHCFVCEHKRCLCKLCGIAFKRLASLKPHYDKFHPGKNISDNIQLITVEETTTSSCDAQRLLTELATRSNENSFIDLCVDESVDSQVIDKESRMISDSTLNDSSKNQVVSEKTSQSPMENISNQSYSCSICGLTFQNYYQIFNHKLKHKEAKFRCPYCSKKFYFQKRFEVHATYCAGLKLACELCDKKFNHLTRLQSHIKRDHHGRGRLISANTEDTDCSSAKTQNSVINANDAPEKEAQPTIVPLDENIDLQLDIKVEETKMQEQGYQVPNERSESSLGTTLFLIQHGEKSTNDQTADKLDNVVKVEEEYPEDEEDNFSKHKSKTDSSEIHGISSDRNDSPVNQEAGEKCASCSICGLTFRKRTIMKYHVLVCHTDPRHKCSNCEKMFHRPSLLRHHEKSCSAKQCKKCGVWFSKRRRLNNPNAEKRSATETHFTCESCEVLQYASASARSQLV